MKHILTLLLVLLFLLVIVLVIVVVYILQFFIPVVTVGFLESLIGSMSSQLSWTLWGILTDPCCTVGRTIWNLRISCSLPFYLKDLNNDCYHCLIPRWSRWLQLLLLRQQLLQLLLIIIIIVVIIIIVIRTISVIIFKFLIVFMISHVTS